ncbi:hypothetical protein [Nocardia veterana]|uniref:Uncharacterized protein n=1 Tax=Nocardia veterana TaxID=132249 RepID=A0A7X6LXW3_9NOCA|nr:hypothetical protein [Nocardia veterana]NKY86552.1 hypothetical protein [Nocardia veterana]
MPSANSVPTLSRAEFDRLEHRGAAGATAILAEMDSAVADRWRREQARWRGRHWAYLDDEHGVLRLHPVNVTRASSRAAA